MGCCYSRAVLSRLEKINGSITDYGSVGIPADLDFTIENRPANSSIGIAVSAVNNGGESEFPDVITIATH
jgi:hypothetical protein